MNDFDYDVFGSEEVREEHKKVDDSAKETKDEFVAETKKVEAKKVKTVKTKPSEPSEFEVFEMSDSEVKEESDSNLDHTENQYDVFGGSEVASDDSSYYDLGDGGYQDDGGSGNRRARTTGNSEAAGLAIAAVAGAALSKSNKVPKAVKNAVNPNYHKEKKRAEEEQFLNARKVRQAKYEQRTKMAANGPKKPLHKRWWFWLLIGLLLLCVMIASCGKDDADKSTTVTTVEEVTTSTTTTTVRTYSYDELEVKKDDADGQWYAYAGDEKALSYTGLAKNSMGIWYIENGKVDFSKSGTESLNGKEYIIDGGKAREKTTTTTSSGVSKEMKDMMADYESFVDQYIAFMKKYENSDDVWGMLADYSSMVSKLGSWEEKFDKMNEDDWSAADWAYYTEVSLRCSQKMLKVAY